MKELISKRAGEVGLTPQAPRTTSAPFDPRSSHRAYGDHSRIAGLRDATMNDPLTDLGAITSRQRSDYDALPRRDEAPKTFAMSKAAVAGVVDECMKQIANVLDKKMLAWNALGWLDVRKGMEKTLELVIANKTKAYPDGYKGDAVPVKVVEDKATDPALVERLTAAPGDLHAYVSDLAAEYPANTKMKELLAASAPLLKDANPQEGGGIGDHDDSEALPKRAGATTTPPLGLASLTKGMWFTAGKQLASLLCKVDRVEDHDGGWISATVNNGNWPIVFDRVTGACLPGASGMSHDQAHGLHINFVGPWKQGLQGYNEHLEYANEQIAARG